MLPIFVSSYCLIMAGAFICILCWLDIRLWKVFYNFSQTLFFVGLMLTVSGCLLEAFFYQKKKTELKKQDTPFNVSRPGIRLFQNACDARSLSAVLTTFGVIILGIYTIRPELIGSFGIVGGLAIFLALLSRFHGYFAEEEAKEKFEELR